MPNILTPQEKALLQSYLAQVQQGNKVLNELAAMAILARGLSLTTHLVNLDTLEIQERPAEVLAPGTDHKSAEEASLKV